MQLPVAYPPPGLGLEGPSSYLPTPPPGLAPPPPGSLVPPVHDFQAWRPACLQDVDDLEDAASSVGSTADTETVRTATAGDAALVAAIADALARSAFSTPTGCTTPPGLCIPRATPPATPPPRAPPRVLKLEDAIQTPQAPLNPPRLMASTAEAMSTTPMLGSSGVPTRGSAEHALGRCKPCAFVFKEGCQSGVDCMFCHLCPLGEKKRRKKERKAVRRAPMAASSRC